VLYLWRKPDTAARRYDPGSLYTIDRYHAADGMNKLRPSVFVPRYSFAMLIVLCDRIDMIGTLEID